MNLIEITAKGVDDFPEPGANHPEAKLALPFVQNLWSN